MLVYQRVIDTEKSPSNGIVKKTDNSSESRPGYIRDTIQSKWTILKGCNTMQGNKVGALAGILRNFQRYFSVKGTLRRILF
jgi:hypothetical protein